MDFLKWYKHKIESNNQEPPETVWENIQDELDIEQSWHVINGYLTRKSARRRNYIIGIAAGFLVLISIGTFWYFAQDTSPEEFQSLAEGISETEDEISGTEDTAPGQLITRNEREEQIQSVITQEIQPVLSEESTYREDLPDETEERDGNIKPPVRSIYATLERREIAMNVNINSVEFFEEPDNVYIEEDTKERTSFKKLYIGSTGQLANTWLLNDKTFNGLDRSSLTTSNASLGSNIGIFLGTNISSKIDLQLDINILVQNNQVYNEYLYGHYIENRMKFNYSQLALSLRYNFFSKKLLRGEHGINLGGYAGYLHNAYQNLDGETVNLSSNYNTLDYGIFLSYEFVIPIYKQLGLGTGFRAYYGLQNIYSGNEYIPAYLNRTKNASATISLSLKYLIK